MNELNVKIVLVTKTRSSEALPNEMVQQKNRYFIKVYHDAMLFPYEKKWRKIVNEERWHKKKQEKTNIICVHGENSSVR